MNRLAYPDDLFDKEWEQIEPILKANAYRNVETRCKYPRHEMLNAMFYILRTGCRWTDLPQLPEKIYTDLDYSVEDMRLRMTRYGIDLETVRSARKPS